MANTAQLSCCNVSEISNLGYGEKSGEEILKQVCQSMCGATYNFKWNTPQHEKITKVKLENIYSIYLFTGVTNKEEIPAYNTPGVIYGGVFNGVVLSKYLREEGLGGVVETGEVFNESFHPESTVQGFLWTPDINKLKKWWIDRGGAA